MVAPIILYDIPINNPKCKAFSPHTWKVRFALNYKGLPLKTEWIEYPDIKALYHKLGLEPTSKNDDGSPYYCLPVIHDPSTKTTILDSKEIIKYLDKTYPDTPPLLPKGTLAFHAAFMATWGPVHTSLFYVVVCAVANQLPERSQVYFRTTREESLGMKLEDVAGEKEWENVETSFAALDKVLSANGKGMDELMMGDKVCYADIQIVSGLLWAKAALGEGSEEWKKIIGWNGGKWARILHRFSQYEVIDA